MDKTRRHPTVNQGLRPLSHLHRPSRGNRNGRSDTQPSSTDARERSPETTSPDRYTALGRTFRETNDALELFREGGATPHNAEAQCDCGGSSGPHVRFGPGD